MLFERKCCCRWPRVPIFFLALSIILVLIFFLVPLDEVLDSFLPNFSGNKDVNYTTTTTTNSPPPIVTSTPQFVFNNCNVIEGSNIMCCNGLESNCDVRVNEIMFASVHNVMDTKEGGNSLLYNHEKAFEGSLHADYRGLNFDVCNCDGILQFRRSYGTRDPMDVFSIINTFLVDNTSKVILLTLQISIGDVNLSALYDLMSTVSGFVNKMYIHDASKSNWPTMRSLVTRNKRLIVFQYNGIPCSSINNPCPAIFHNYFDYATETPWNIPNSTLLANTTYSCMLDDRGINGTRAFYNVNHFLEPPDAGNEEINSYPFLKERLTACATIHNKVPNMVYVDFWNVGNLPEVVQTINQDLSSVRTIRRRQRTFQ